MENRELGIALSSVSTYVLVDFLCHRMMRSSALTPVQVKEYSEIISAVSGIVGGLVYAKFENKPSTKIDNSSVKIAEIVTQDLQRSNGLL